MVHPGSHEKTTYQGGRGQLAGGGDKPAPESLPLPFPCWQAASFTQQRAIKWPPHGTVLDTEDTAVKKTESLTPGR